MKDVVSIHLGQAGVQMGTAVWELLGHEQNIDVNGEVDKVSTDARTDFSFFEYLIGGGRYAPRAILVDLESTVIDNLSRTKYCNFFQREFTFKGVEDAANNFARGYHSAGRKTLKLVRDGIRRQAERSDMVTGFMGFHSMGGGTGSGLGTRVVQHLGNNFPKKAFVQVAVFPSAKTATSVVEPYNTLLATHASMDCSKCVVFVDNEAIYKSCHEFCDVDDASTNMMNNVISQAVSSMTTGLRFDCQQTADFYDFHTNLIPYPRLHFPVVTLSPVVGSKFADTYTILDITSRAFESCGQLADLPKQGTHVACCLIYRGDVTPKDVNETIVNIKKKKVDLVPWIPTGFKIGISPKTPQAIFNGQPVEMKRTVCLMSNNTGLKSCWESLAKKYRLMFSKGAFLHWYLSEGLEHTEFKLALEDINTLIGEYHAIVQE